MDPELLQLFAATRGKNKNVSGVLNNLDNPLLAYLSGALNPMTQTGGGSGGGSLYAQYENYDNPAIQDVLAQIRNGVDKYWLSSYIDSNIDDSEMVASGFQPQDFKGLASALQADYQKGTAKNDMWSKAGLSNPLDIYDESNMPLEGGLSDLVTGFSSESQRAQDLYSKAAQDVSSRKNRIDVAKGAMKDFIGKLQGGGAGMPNDVAIRRLREDIEKRDVVTSEDLANLVEKYSPAKRGNDKVYEEKYRDRIARASKNMPQVSSKDMQAVDEAQQEAFALQNIAKKQAEQERMIRQSILRNYQAQGRTPLKDELSTMMRFVSGSNG